MVGPNGFEPSTSSVSRKRSGPTELRAYVELLWIHSNGGREIPATLDGRALNNRQLIVYFAGTFFGLRNRELHGCRHLVLDRRLTDRLHVGAVAAAAQLVW
jgi:hypothetical protein